MPRSAFPAQERGHPGDRGRQGREGTHPHLGRRVLHRRGGLQPGDPVHWIPGSRRVSPGREDICHRHRQGCHRVCFLRRIPGEHCRGCPVEDLSLQRRTPIAGRAVLHSRSSAHGPEYGQSTAPNVGSPARPLRRGAHLRETHWELPASVGPGGRVPGCAPRLRPGGRVPSPTTEKGESRRAEHGPGRRVDSFGHGAAACHVRQGGGIGRGGARAGSGDESRGDHHGGSRRSHRLRQPAGRRRVRAGRGPGLLCRSSPSCVPVYPAPRPCRRPVPAEGLDGCTTL